MVSIPVILMSIGIVSLNSVILSPWIPSTSAFVLGNFLAKVSDDVVLAVIIISGVNIESINQ